MGEITLFAGTPQFCGLCEPHEPHIVGTYDTVRYGMLDRFCPGFPGPGELFRVVGYLRGSAEFPTIFRWARGSQVVEPRTEYLGEVQGELAEQKVATLYESIRARCWLRKQREEAERLYGPEELDWEFLKALKEDGGA